MNPLAGLRAHLAAAARERGAPEGVVPRLERARRPEFGDYSTNAAMELAPVLRRAPREVAEGLGEALRERLGGAVERVEVAGPGFLNLFLSDGWRRAALAHVLDAGEEWGRPSAPGAAERVLVEFVSANPTGPITVASGRHAAYGDSLARVLERAGHRVEREFYVNDHGNQVRLFGESLRARARGEEPPEDGYRGAYVAELAAAIPDAADADVGRARAGGGGADARRGARDARALPGALRHLLLRALPARGRRTRRGGGAARGARRGVPQRGRHLAADERARRRQGPRPSPLLRRARPTSPPTWPTTATSSSAATTARSTCWAPTITATWGGSARRGRPSAARRTRSRSRSCSWST